MRENAGGPRWRETALMVTLGVLFLACLFWFLLLITGWAIVAFLATLAVFAALAALHYLTWGRSLEDDERRRRAEELWDMARGRPRRR